MHRRDTQMEKSTNRIRWKEIVDKHNVRINNGRTIEIVSMQCDFQRL